MAAKDSSRCHFYYKLQYQEVERKATHIPLKKCHGVKEDHRHRVYGSATHCSYIIQKRKMTNKQVSDTSTKKL